MVSLCHNGGKNGVELVAVNARVGEDHTLLWQHQIYALEPGGQFYHPPSHPTQLPQLFNVQTVPTLISSGNGGRSCPGPGMHWNATWIGLCAIRGTATPLSFWFATTTGCLVWTTDKRVGCQGRPVSWQSLLLWVFLFSTIFWRCMVLASLFFGFPCSFGSLVSFLPFLSLHLHLVYNICKCGGCYHYSKVDLCTLVELTLPRILWQKLGVFYSENSEQSKVFSVYRQSLRPVISNKKVIGFRVGLAGRIPDLHP